MCNRPNDILGQQVACRTCDQCLEARTNDWTYRCMAEAAASENTFALTLTYADHEDGTRPNGSITFDYRDVQNALKAVRQSIKRQTGETASIRYLVCGEVGSKGTQRVHYHLILFTSVPLLQLTQWRDFYAGPDSPEIQHGDITLDRNYIWSGWPHGHVRLQKPDRKGMRYAVKYAMKHLTGVKASRGTNRITKADTWPASFFMMSKKPPIGFPYFENLCAHMRAMGWFPPSLRFSIPDCDGFYHPTGAMREKLLLKLRAVAVEYYAEHGRMPATFRSFVSSLALDDPEAINPDLETFTYGKETKEQGSPSYGWIIDPFEATARKVDHRDPRQHDAHAQAFKRVQRLEAFTESYGREIARRKSAHQGAFRAAQLARNCGGSEPCHACQHTAEIFGDGGKIATLFEQQFAAFQNARPLGADKTLAAFDAWYQRTSDHAHPFCQRKNDPAVLEAFAAKRARRDLEAGITGRQTGVEGIASDTGPKQPPAVR